MYHQALPKTILRNLSPEEELEAIESNINQEFKVLTAFWIIFMQGGFAFLEAGSVRSKNTTNILFKNLLDMFIGTLTYWSVGFAFSYGNPGNGFIGNNYFFATNVYQNRYSVNSTLTTLTLSNKAQEYYLASENYYAAFVAGFGYAAAASTIVSGALAERVHVSGYLIFSTFMTGFIYPVVCHWVWDEKGWLFSGAGLDVSFLDYAGSSVVHVTGGISALIGAKCLGPRIGFNSEDGGHMRGHSVPLFCIGGFMLLIGFLAFNVASQQHITEIGDGTAVSMSVANTIVSASSSALTAVLADIFASHLEKKNKNASLLTTINGCLTGLVAISAGSNQMASWAAGLTGVLAGMSLVAWTKLLMRFQIDDPVNAVPVHLGGGLTGALTAQILALHGQNENGRYVGGLIYGGGILALKGCAWNILGVLCILLWSGVASTLLFLIISKMKLLRVSEKDEKNGLDLVYHGEKAYPKSESLPIRRMINYDF